MRAGLQLAILTRRQPETRAALEKLPKGTVSEASMRLGLLGDEPLLLCLDGMLRYARAHEKRYGGKLCKDYVLGPLWLETVKGLRGLLNGDGAVAMELGVSTDSKDNGVCEAVFWAGMNAARFGEGDL